jgi:hypothetical protein
MCGSVEDGSKYLYLASRGVDQMAWSAVAPARIAANLDREVLIFAAIHVAIVRQFRQIFKLFFCVAVAFCLHFGKQLYRVVLYQGGTNENRIHKLCEYGTGHSPGALVADVGFAAVWRKPEAVETEWHSDAELPL